MDANDGRLYVGLISGTSRDGVDAVLALHVDPDLPAAQAAMVPNPDNALTMKAPGGPMGPISGQFSRVIV